MEKNDDDKELRHVVVHLKWPIGLREIGWAMWWLMLGTCLGLSLHNFARAWRGLY